MSLKVALKMAPKVALKIREVIENALDFCLSVQGGLIEFTEDIAYFREKMVKIVSFFTLFHQKTS